MEDLISTIGAAYGYRNLKPANGTSTFTETDDDMEEGNGESKLGGFGHLSSLPETSNLSEKEVKTL
jgi:hypothetical protein